MASNHIKIINLVDEIKEQIPEGIYLQLCNELKKNKDDYDTIAINRPVDSNTQGLNMFIELLQNQLSEGEDERFELMNDNLNLERKCGDMRLEVRKLDRENINLKHTNSKLRQENMKLRQEKIKDIDVSIFEDMSDISDIEIDDSSDDEEKGRKLPTAKDLFGSGDSSDDE